MKQAYFIWSALCLFLGWPLASQAQTGGVRIGTAGAPDASAVLDLKPDATATPKGFLPPRLTLAQRSAIGSPATGLVVYQTDGAPGLYVYNGSSWVLQGDNLGNHTATQNLNLQANALTGTGSNVGPTVGVGVRADGGLNLGQNTVGNNLYLGYQAGQANTTGDHNVQVGYQAGLANTTGHNNQLSGYQAGFSNTTGSQNVFSGTYSGYANTTGNFNVFVGYQAGQANTTGSFNVLSGSYSGHDNTTGNSNIFSGYNSGYANKTGSGNLFTGSFSGFSNTTGSNNVFSASASGYNNTTGSFNQFTGASSGYSNTTGSHNIFSGYQAGYTNTTGSFNQFLGDSAGFNNTASFNTFIGRQAGYGNTTGDSNLFIGARSGYANTTGYNNVFAGILSGYANTTGFDNTFSGTGSGYANTTGNYNVFDGYVSGFSNTTGFNNTFSGTGSGFSNTTGYQNVFDGFTSGYSNTTGSQNVFDGYVSGRNNTTGYSNTFTGWAAGSYNVTGHDNTALGVNSGPLDADNGDLANATALGANVKLTQSNTVVLGNDASVGIGTSEPIAKLHVKGGVPNYFANTGNISYFAATSGFVNNVGSGAQVRTVCAYFEGGNVFVNNAIHAGRLSVSSDARIKHVVGRSSGVADLALLQQLRITDYTYLDPVAHGSQVTKKVIAQEVEAVLPAAVSRSTQALPNVYARATAVRFADGVITLTCPTPHGLPAAGGRLRLYTATNQDLSPAVTVVDAHTVRFAATQAYPEGLFVYGKYVDDFRSVDYDALTTLTVSATQELARQVAALQAQNAALRQQQQATRAAQQADHASLETLQAELARLREAVLPAAQAQR